MTNNKIEPAKITKPIQLLAAWLAGLVVINGIFLGAAASITLPTWAPALLVTAAVVNVPLFLVAIFLLQTRFRPEMQEDEFYYRYLSSRYSADTGTNEVVISTSSKSLIDIKGRGSSNIVINDMLPNYSAIRSALQNNNIKITDTFGSTSAIPEVPPHLLLTIESSNIDIELLQNVVEALKSYIDFIGFVPNGWKANTIYIGSYAYREEGFSNNKKWTKKLESQLLDPNLKQVDLVKLLN